MAKLSFFSNVSPREQLGRLIENVANSGCRKLNENDLKEFKNLCKNGDDDLIDFVYRVMIMNLEKNHSQKRYSTILLIEQLFPRSHRFRTLFTDQANLNYFFKLTLAPQLPKPKLYAKLLKEKVNQLVKVWIDKYGIGYPYLEQIYKLAISLSIPVNQTIIDDQEDPIELNNQINLNIVSTINSNLNGNSRINQYDLNEVRQQERIENILIEYSTLEGELSNLFTQIKNCFDQITPKDEFSLDSINSKKDEEIDFEMSRLTNKNLNKQHQVSITLKPYLEIKIDKNNENTINELKEFYKKLVTDYLPKIKSLLKNLSKAGSRCESEVKQLIEFKNQCLQFISMYAELRFKDTEDGLEIENNLDEEQNSIDNFDSIGNENESSSDDDDFEEVEEQDIESEIPPEFWTKYGISDPFINKYSSDSNLPSTSGLNLIDFNPNACNVKMENGNLCKREDKIKCPFHGKIIPRDHDGNLIDPELRKQEENESKRRKEDWQDPKYLKDLENQIGIDLTIKRTKKKANPELLCLRTCDETPKSRLMKKMKFLKR